MARHQLDGTMVVMLAALTPFEPLVGVNLNHGPRSVAESGIGGLPKNQELIDACASKASPPT